MPESVVTATACANFALIKYWGKRDPALNLPATDSLSLTVNTLKTTTTVSVEPELTGDVFQLNGMSASEGQRLRVSRFLDLIRRQSGLSHPMRVESTNTFPDSAGLASSASAFAALAAAAARSAGLDMDRTALSALARQGSGSAARSVFGGFVRMQAGTETDGTDAVGVQVADENHWPLHMLVAVTDDSSKMVGSTEGMEHSRKTSPFYEAFIEGQDNAVLACADAVRDRDMEKLIDLMEANCLAMHAVMISSRPGLLYWNAATVRLIHEVRRMRRSGLAVGFTIDAGPQVKVLVSPESLDAVKDRLMMVDGILNIYDTAPGPGVQWSVGS